MHIILADPNSFKWSKTLTLNPSIYGKDKFTYRMDSDARSISSDPPRVRERWDWHEKYLARRPSCRMLAVLPSKSQPGSFPRTRAGAYRQHDQRRNQNCVDTRLACSGPPRWCHQLPLPHWLPTSAVRQVQAILAPETAFLVTQPAHGFWYTYAQIDACTAAHAVRAC